MINPLLKFLTVVLYLVYPPIGYLCPWLYRWYFAWRHKAFVAKCTTIAAKNLSDAIDRDILEGLYKEAEGWDGDND
jgi:hypothetical protein